MKDPECGFKTVSVKVGGFLLVLILCLAPLNATAAQSRPRLLNPVWKGCIP